MRLKILLLLSLITTYCFADCNVQWKEGDIVFQTSKSKQAPFVMIATRSLYTHCGIIVYKNNKPYVLEASNVVKLTSIDEWFNKSRFGDCTTYRVFDKPIKINYKKYLGQKYDISFKFNNGRMYCSELVYEIYKNQFGIELCKPRKVKDYHIFGMKKLLKRRHINPNQLVVSPSDIANSKYVKVS